MKECSITRTNQVSKRARGTKILTPKLLPLKFAEQYRSDFKNFVIVKYKRLLRGTLSCLLVSLG